MDIGCNQLEMVALAIYNQVAGGLLEEFKMHRCPYLISSFTFYLIDLHIHFM
jgi:hypothetical protein